jgi:hypothetical protein
MTARELQYRLLIEGTEVSVKANRNSYRNRDYTGKTGKVIRNQYDSYGKIVVELDDETNPRSGKGYFYFKPNELEIISENNNMEGNNMQNVTNYINIARIQYLNSNTQSGYYYANFDATLKEGDLVVVKSLNHGLGLAKVTEIVDATDIGTPREIVAKVDTADYDARVATRKTAAELKSKMEQRAKQLQDVALYQLLAEKDSEMAALLAQYRDLSLV